MKANSNVQVGVRVTLQSFEAAHVKLSGFSKRLEFLDELDILHRYSLRIPRIGGDTEVPSREGGRIRLGWEEHLGDGAHYTVLRKLALEEVLPEYLSGT